jgi:hypothetical protein
MIAAFQAHSLNIVKTAGSGTKNSIYELSAIPGIAAIQEPGWDQISIVQ